MDKNYMLKGIPPEFWHKVKIYCTTKQITIKQLILNLLNKEIKDSDKNKPV